MLQLETGENLPYSLEAEQSILGSILIDPSCINIVMQYLKPRSFFINRHGELYALLISMATNSQTIDIITVLNAVRQEGIFQTDEDAKIYLSQLAQIVPSTTNIESYTKIVQEKFYIRTLMTTARDIFDNCASSSADVSTLLDDAEQKIFDIRQGKETKGLIHIRDILIQAYDSLQKISGEDSEKYAGLSSGFKGLDRVISGLNPSDLILLAARPAMGKTSFALNIATNVAKLDRKVVAVFSLEMSKEQLVLRMLSSESQIQGNQFKSGNLSPDDWIRIAQSASLLSKLNLYIDDSAGITVPEIKAKLRRMKNLGLVVIDYLQLMSSSGRRNENRVQEVSEMTRGLKIMAKELNVPIITLSQLSRGPDARADHRPMLSDLRESGSIEQDADIVMFLYREHYYDQENGNEHTAECIVAKNRHGETKN
ncbi:MAG: replicative DNA helicase, partial [Oscillospiraceae bacterium]